MASAKYITQKERKMNKKVSLREIVGTKIIYAIILVSYYWMWARTDWKDWYPTLQHVLACFLAVFLHFSK